MIRFDNRLTKEDFTSLTMKKSICLYSAKLILKELAYAIDHIKLS